MVARQITTTIHGHFLERVPAGPGPFPLLLGFHGYAETAEDHLRELEAIPGAEHWLLCAVQGLHTFYRGRTGTIGASWMTRFNRELAIADNLAYVRAVVADLKARHPVGERVVLSGFSQGVAMAYRAARFCDLHLEGLFALAADVPPDVAAEPWPNPPRILQARGNSDSGYSAEQMENDLATLTRLGVPHEAFTFAGGHEWTPELRARVGEWLVGMA